VAFLLANLAQEILKCRDHNISVKFLTLSIFAILTLVPTVSGTTPHEKGFLSPELPPNLDAPARKRCSQITVIQYVIEIILLAEPANGRLQSMTPL